MVTDVIKETLEQTFEGKKSKELLKYLPRLIVLYRARFFYKIKVMFIKTKLKLRSRARKFINIFQKTDYDDKKYTDQNSLKNGMCYFSYSMDFEKSGISKDYAVKRIKEVVNEAYKKGIKYFYIKDELGLSLITGEVLIKMSRFRLRMELGYTYLNFTQFLMAESGKRKKLFGKFGFNPLMYTFNEGEENPEEKLQLVEAFFMCFCDMLVIDKNMGENDTRLAVFKQNNQRNAEIIELFGKTADKPQ